MAVRTVSPFRCRMWEMHDRLSENIDVRSCGALIDSIRKHGQKQPVLGRPPSRRDNFEYELIYGARRLFAAQHLGIDLLLDVRELDDRTALIEMDVENRVRADISAYERGRSYQRWLTSGYFKNQTEMAKALGVSDSQVSRLLRYAELPAAVVGAFSSPNDIREEWAVALAKMCAEPDSRARVINRARRLSAVPARGSPQTVFDILVNGRGSRSCPPSRSRDDVIRDPRGRPLFRVRFQANAVQLVLPREAITVPGLRRINECVAQILVAEAEKATSVIQARARYAPTEIVANGTSPAEGRKPCAQSAGSTCGQGR